MASALDRDLGEADIVAALDEPLGKNRLHAGGAQRAATGAVGRELLGELQLAPRQARAVRHRLVSRG